MDKLYTKVGWKNEPDKTTPINETNLGKMDNGINDLDDRVIELDNNKVDKVAGKGLSTNDYTDAEKQKLSGIEAGAQVNSVTSVAGKTGAVELAKGDLDLGNVDNTSDANKPISTATQTALNTIASAFKKSRLWNESKLATPISEYGFGTPAAATSKDNGKQYLDLATGHVYTCVQQGADYYVWRQGDARLPLEINEIGKAISKIWDLGVYSRTTLIYSFGNPTGMYDGAKEGSNAYVLDVLNGIVYKNTRMGQSSWTWVPQANLSLITNAISEELTNSKTASGSMITLTDASESNLVECVVTISSSTNTVTITVKDKSTNPTVTNTYTIDLGRTVSSGTLDVVKGTLTTGGTTYNLPPTQIKLLKGNNVISSNVSSLSIKYYPDNVLGQLKGDIEDEYDERVETLETQVQELQPSLIFMSRERRDITSDLSRLSTAVAEQNLAKYGYKIGDYFTGASGYTYILADYNTFKGTATPYCITSNHLGIVVDTHATSQWHSGDASNVGYNGSTLHTYLKGTVMDNIKSDFIALFGGSTGLEHLLSHSKLLTTALANWGWQANQYISALSEVQTIGSVVWGASGYQTGEASKKLEIFNKYKWTEIFEGRYPWLRDMQPASYACYLDNHGHAYYDRVTGAGHVVGLINFY